MPRLDEVDAGRFERLEEAAGEAQRDEFLFQACLRVPGGEAQRPRLGERLAVEVGQQRRARASSSLMSGCE